MIPNYAWATAAVGSIGIFWNYLRSFFTRVSSYVIVTADLNGSLMPDSFMTYLKKHYRQTPFSPRRFTAYKNYVRPMSRQCLVGYEQVSSALTFFNGWRPIFVAGTQNKDGSFNGDVKITFIRGTFDLDKILIDAIDEMDSIQHSTQRSDARYYVRKVFGRRGKNEAREDMGEAKSIFDSGGAFNFPIKWKKEEIGAPLSGSPFAHLKYSPHIMAFSEEIRRWKKSEKWYRERSLSWRLGIGINGPPGTGKTSWVRAIGQELDMPIHIYDLTTMSNEDLIESWRNSLNATPCIVLFEDADRIFDDNKQIKQAGNGQPLTLDCLLNCISGIEPSDGILVVVTANNIERMDPALGIPDGKGGSTRNGRLDKHVYFGPLDDGGRLAIAQRILSDCPDYIDEVVTLGEGETGAQFEYRCGKIAIEEFWKKSREENGTL